MFDPVYLLFAAPGLLLSYWASSRVLDAAALTYVAAAVSSVSLVMYYLFRAGVLGGGRDD